MSKYMAVSQEHIDKFSGILKNILDEELKSGNVIKETYDGWPAETTSIALEKPFKKPVKKNLPGIEFFVYSRHTEVVCLLEWI